MTEERAKRKLTAIFSADVKGYSRLMRADEVATVETLKKYREVMASLIQEYRGRVVDAPGGQRSGRVFECGGCGGMCRKDAGGT